MPDDLRTRIAAVQEQHRLRNHWRPRAVIVGGVVMSSTAATAYTRKDTPAMTDWVEVR